MKKINIGKEVKYLSEVMSELPENCLFNKGVVGGGGTTIALQEKANTIIAVPFTELIDNKIQQTQENKHNILPHKALGVYYGVYDFEILDYLNNKDIKYKKIMVTYDSLGRVLKYIDPKEYKILIDEYHILFTEYSYRRDAALQVLYNFKLFKSFTFMTATPIDEEFILSELKGLPVVEAVWEDYETVSIIPINTVNGILKSTIVYARKFLDGEAAGNVYFFVNSVRFIQEVLKKMPELDDSNTRVIYSNHNTTKLRIKRGKTMDEPKKINFITSKAFEGADIYDEDGQICVISDPNREHTLVDISTKLIQIAGRIRDTQYGDKVYHLCYEKDNRYTKDGLSYEEYKVFAEEEREFTIEAMEQANELARKRDRPDYLKRTYEGGALPMLLFRDGELCIDDNTIKIDLYNYKIANHIYKNKVNRTKAYQKMPQLKLEEEVVHIVQDTFANFDDTNIFKETIEKLYELSQKKEMALEYQQLFVGAIEEYPFLEKAVHHYGWDRLKEMKFNKGNIERAVSDLEIKENKENMYSKIAMILINDGQFRNGKFYTTKEVKEYFTKVHERLDIKASAKGSDIEKYFSTRSASKRVDGKLTRGYHILSSLNQLKK